MQARSAGREPAPRQAITYRVLVALALLWGCATFAIGISWLRSAIAWSRDDRAVQWQQYSMSALLLSFAVLVALGTWKPRVASRIFLGLFGVTLVQGATLMASTGDGAGPKAVLVGCLAGLGVPALLAARLFRWRGRWQPNEHSRTIASRASR